MGNLFKKQNVDKISLFQISPPQDKTQPPQGIQFTKYTNTNTDSKLSSVRILILKFQAIMGVM